MTSNQARPSGRPSPLHVCTLPFPRLFCYNRRVALFCRREHYSRAIKARAIIARLLQQYLFRYKSEFSLASCLRSPVRSPAT